MILDKVILSGYSDYFVLFYRLEGLNDQITLLDIDRFVQGVINVLLVIIFRFKDFYSFLVEFFKVCLVKIVLYFLYI